MSTDRVTFKCTECEHPVSVDQDNPPDDHDVISCLGCGRDFGAYREVKAALVEFAKAEIDRITEKALA